MTEQGAMFGGRVNGDGPGTDLVPHTGQLPATYGRPVPDRPWQTGDKPPHNHAAERYVLACCLSSAEAIAEAAEIVVDTDFFLPAHQVIFLTCVFMWSAGDPVNAITVLDRIEQEGHLRALGGPNQAAVMLAELAGLLAAAPQVGYHAQIVKSEAVRRSLIAVGMRLQQRGGAEDPYEQLAAAEAELREVGRWSQPGGLDRPMTSAEFIALDWERQPPVVDGLLDREDRAIFTGGEGAGKTTLLLQIGFGKAIGVHPFTQEPMHSAGRVLWLDFENPRRHVDRELRKFHALAERYGEWDRQNFTIWAHPGGVNLSLAADRARVASVIARTQPDLVIGGPIYKMIRDKGEGAEQLHSTVTGFWDDQRGRFGFALILETHQPGQVAGAKRVARPIGSSIYQRWPEFGFTLTHHAKGVLKFERFRLDRERGRVWPVKVEWNRMPRPCWPWLPIYDAGTLQNELQPNQEGSHDE